MKQSRRHFLKQQLSTGIFLSMFNNSEVFAENTLKNNNFIFPVEGDIIHNMDGETNESEQSIIINVLFSAPFESSIIINNKPATFNKEKKAFEASIVLKKQKNTITVENKMNGEKKSITVFYAPHFNGKYRLSVDDNIWFLKDLTVNSNKYNSIFDTPFLAVFKRLHEKFGTKVHFNLFYETEGFNLSKMTDKYKKEWKDNADWIRLSFHANQEFPDRPYLNASYEKVEQDCKKVLAEIKRFAGEASLAKVTTLHWGAANVQGSRALRDAGYTTQVGYFNVDDEALEPVAYYLTKDEIRHIKKRFVWHDTKENISFVRASIVVDTKALTEIPSYLNAHAIAPPFADFLVHEQYFYSHYTNYQPDYEQKLNATIEWAHQKGYKPAFIKESLF